MRIMFEDMENLRKTCTYLVSTSLFPDPVKESDKIIFELKWEKKPSVLIQAQYKY